MPIGDSNCLDKDYRFERTYNNQGQVASTKTIFSKKFLRERGRIYDARANKYVKREIFGGIS